MALFLKISETDRQVSRGKNKSPGPSMMTTSCIATAAQRPCSGRAPKENRVFGRFSQLSIWPGGNASSRNFNSLIGEHAVVSYAVDAQQWSKNLCQGLFTTCRIDLFRLRETSRAPNRVLRSPLVVLGLAGQYFKYSSVSRGCGMESSSVGTICIVDSLELSTQSISEEMLACQALVFEFI